MKLSNWRIGPRVGMAFGVVVVLIALMGAVAVAGLNRSAQNTDRMAEGMQRQHRTAQTLLLAKDNAIASMVVLVSSSPEQQAKLQREIAERDARIVTLLDNLVDEASATPEAVQLHSEARKRHATYAAGVKRITGLVVAGKQAEATFAADEEMIPMLAPFLSALSRLDAHELAHVEAVQARNAALIGQARAWTLGAALAAAALAALAGWAVVRSITRPLHQALQMTERVARGDLTVDARAQGRDEVAQLLHALNRMAGNLSGLVRGVRDVAEGVATASSQIAAGNSSLSERTEQQASTLQQTAASMEQLGSTVVHNANNAAQADSLAQQASRVAAEGGGVVDEVIASIRGIDQSSRRIADIIGTIDGIAFQTNILALNAAVEAARAGEQGRGFAVVAGEVRSLAQRSAQAAREIKTLIDSSVHQVNQGTELADRAGGTMQQVVEAIGRVSTIMGEISHASGEQRDGVRQVGQAVTQMDHSTQQNAALVEQSTAAAESLRDQAQQLVQSVAAFKLA